MQKVISWLLAILTALILLQTLFFKFSAAAESVYIFSTLFGKYEAIMRIGSGVAEGIAALLLLIPKTRAMGACLSLGVISGAVLSHLFKLGISVQNDGGLLFYLALLVFVSSATLLYLHKKELPFIGHRL